MNPDQQGEQRTLVETFPVDTEDAGDTDIVGAKQRRKRSVSLWLSDAILLCIEHVQLFALTLSMSLSWGWPLSWIRGTSFALLFNLDFWEFIKVHTVYQGRTHAFEDPNTIPFSYLGYALAWLAAATILPLLGGLAYLAISRVPYFSPVQTLLFRARLVRALVIVSQVLSVPLGLVVVRLFDCQHYATLGLNAPQHRSIVLKDTECWSGSHLGVLVPLLAASIFHFVVFPVWMIYRIRKELISPSLCACRTWRTHEKYVLVKEAEYLLGLDIAWAINHYPLFSSFRRPWVWFRPFSFFAKAIILVLYGGLFYSLQYQVITIFVFVGVCWVAVVLIPVYRLYSFHLMLVFSMFINLCNLILGTLLALEVQNALLIGQNLVNALVVINTAWLFVAILWGTYLFLCSSKASSLRCRPVWPLLSELDVTTKRNSSHTQKFAKAILAARQVAERCYSSTQFFAPVHELSTQIQIINAYCREAEVLEDPMHPSLWGLLSELIDLHTELYPHSVFKTSTKEHIPQPVQELMRQMPYLRKRLEQREYDLSLWRPAKRRILLKLLAVATFMNNRSVRVRIRLDQSSVARASTMSLLRDDTEQENDTFLQEVEQWEVARRTSASMKRPLRAVSHMPSTSSIELQATDAFVQGVEKWEKARKVSIQARPTRNQNRKESTQSTDAFVRDIEKWEKERRISIETRSNRLPRRPNRPSSTQSIPRPGTKQLNSKLSVRFNLDTISEMEAEQTHYSSNSSSESTSSLSSAAFI